MTRAILSGAAAAALLMAGCTSYLPVNGEGDRTALPPAAKAAQTPSPSPTPQAYAPPATPAGSHDTCGAAALQYLIGKDRAEIPVPTDLARRRVTCTTCPVTQDFRPDRQTITYDQATGKVVGVRCG